MPGDAKARERILAYAPQLVEKGVKLDESAAWYTYIVPRVPATVAGVAGSMGIGELMTDEVLRATKVKPTAAAPSKHSKPDNPHQDWVISFLRPVSNGFRLFGSSPARKIERKPRANQCHRCQGFHDPRNCDRAARCLNCGAEHPAGPRAKHPRCANCHGLTRRTSRAARPGPEHGKGGWKNPRPGSSRLFAN